MYQKKTIKNKNRYVSLLDSEMCVTALNLESVKIKLDLEVMFPSETKDVLVRFFSVKFFAKIKHVVYNSRVEGKHLFLYETDLSRNNT